ncbi:MAG: hypothetical protein KOO62_08775 [candidate division Zixibacteria bacterium]|nr:hypothetical protein [candidate division Zixibacteria bacterium]
MTSLIVRSVTIVLLLAVSGLGQGFSQVNPEPYRLEFTGGGARAEGMGNAFLAVSDDVTAGSWNPAGLYGLEKPIISLAWSSLRPRGESSTIITIGDDTRVHSGSFSSVSAMNFVAPLRVKGHQFVGSVSFTRNSNEYLPILLSMNSIVINRIPLDVEGRTQYIIDTIPFEENRETELSGGLESISFGAGTRVFGNFAAGVALNIYSGTMIRDWRQLSLSEPHMDPVDGQTRQMVLTVQSLDSTKFSGFNFTLGVKYSGEKFDFGGIIRTPFSLNAKTGRSLYIINKINGLPVDNITDTLYFDDNLIKYDVPWIVAAGVAYRPTDKLTLAADGELRSFGNSKIDVRDSLFLDPGGENTEFFDERDPEWDDVFHLRLGGEYMMESSIGRIPLRAGFGYVPLILPSYNAEGTKSRTGRTTMSLGAGIWWEQIHLDAAYTYSSFDYDEYGFFSINSKDHHLNLMFTGYF